MRIAFHSYDSLMALTHLTPSKYQRNKHPKEQIEILAKIMREHGVRHPIHISKLSGTVCFGHGRWEAAKLNGWKEFPIVYQEFANDQEEYACVQSDNAIALWAELDIPQISMDVADLKDFDIDLLGIKDFELAPIEVVPGCDEDEIPEQVDPKTKLGDIYQLGQHRLMCGDSTSIDAVDELMAGEKADMVFTDPPYGMGLKTNFSDAWGEKSNRGGGIGRRSTKNHKEVIGDDKDFDFGSAYAIFEHVKEQFWWGADYYCQQLPKGCGWLVWDKTGGNESLTDVGFSANFELCWSKQKHKRDLVRHTYKGVAGMKKEDGNRVHPTQKPVGLAEHFIKTWSEASANVIDLFGGSGSTLIACEKTNRKCFMMELDPHYCDVIVARWEKYTNKKAELLNAKGD